MFQNFLIFFDILFFFFWKRNIPEKLRNNIKGPVVSDGFKCWSPSAIIFLCPASSIPVRNRRCGFTDYVTPVRISLNVRVIMPEISDTVPDPSFPSIKASTTRSRENRDRAWRWEQGSSDRRPRWSRTLTTAKSQVPLFHFFQFPHHLFYHVFIF